MSRYLPRLVNKMDIKNLILIFEIPNNNSDKKTHVK